MRDGAEDAEEQRGGRQSVPETGTGARSGQPRPAARSTSGREDGGGDEAARGLQHHRVGVAGDAGG